MSGTIRTMRRSPRELCALRVMAILLERDSNWSFLFDLMPRTDDAITGATGITAHWLSGYFVSPHPAACARPQIAVVTLLCELSVANRIQLMLGVIHVAITSAASPSSSSE